MMGDWTFFSNYGHVLVCLARNSEARLRDVALDVGITERAVQKIVRDLQNAGFLTISKQGRCNRYRINRRKGLRHSLESSCTVGQLLTLVARPRHADPAGIQEPDPEPVPITEKVQEEAMVEAEKVPDQPVPPPEVEKEMAREKKKERARAPVDTRRQGSLF